MIYRIVESIMNFYTYNAVNLLQQYNIIYNDIHSQALSQITDKIRPIY